MGIRTSQSDPVIFSLTLGMRCVSARDVTCLVVLEAGQCPFASVVSALCPFRAVGVSMIGPRIYFLWWAGLVLPHAPWLLLQRPQSLCGGSGLQGTPHGLPL